MYHNFNRKGISKGISQLVRINKMMNINHSLKYKSNNIINLYSTLTPKEAINPKSKNLLISPKIEKPKDNIKQSKTTMVKNNNSKKKNNNEINDAIKKNIQYSNINFKGSLSTTNLKTNYGFFKTKKLKSTKSLFNKLNRFGSSFKMNIKLPKHNIFSNKNNNNSKSREKIISSILEEKTKQNQINIFRKSMSHNKMIFPNMDENNIDKIKEEFEYTGSEPNSRQKSLDKYNDNNKKIRKKEIKKAIKQLLTVNTDFDIGTFNKIKFNFNHWTNNNNVSKENIKRELINFSSRKNSKVNINNEIKKKEKLFKENFNSENAVKNNNIKINNNTKNNNNVFNNLSRLNLIQNSINNTSKSNNKIKNIQIKNRYKKEPILKNRIKKEEKSNIIKHNFKSPQHIADKGNNIILLYSNDSKNKSKNKKVKSKTINKNININININDIKTTNININNININNEMRKQIIDENINPVTNININNINSEMNNVINYITNFNSTNINNYIKENKKAKMNSNNKNNNDNHDSNQTYKNAKSAKNIINKGLNLKNILNLQPKKNISNATNDYYNIMNSDNNIKQNTIEKKDQRQTYFSPDTNRISMFTTSNNNLIGHKNQIELIKNIKDKKLSKNIRNNIISNIIKVEEVISQKNKKINKILSSSYSQKNELISNQKIKVRLKNQEPDSNQNQNAHLEKENKANINELNMNNLNNEINVNKLINKHINKFNFGSISSNDILNQVNQFKNLKKSKMQKYFEKLKSNEPVKPYKVIKYFYNYLKANELEELKKLRKKKAMVYYIGEILPRISKNEKTHIIIFNTTDNIKSIITKDNIINDNNMQMVHCTSCHNLRTKKSKDFYKLYNKIKNINPNLDGKFDFNDRDGYYTFKKGYQLNYRYEIISLLGKGTFGEALQCYDHKNKEIVCIKIINARKDFQTQAMVEIKILTSISLNDSENEFGNVKFYQYFNFRSHICLVFELLGQNLFESLQLNNFIGLDLSKIRCYTTELLFSLMFLRKLKIIHCDLKPENILLVPKSKNKIKIIDFGSSCFEYEITYTYIQSRFYRAPEVILDLGYGYAIDIWSIGCILCELYTGNPIFPGSDEMEQINYIMKCIGPPDDSLKESSFKARFFFDSEINVNFEEFENQRKYSKKEVKTNLKKYFNVYNNTSSGSFREDNSQLSNFIDFISCCLEWDQKKRITPEEGLMHPFIIDNLSEEQLNIHKAKIKKIKNKLSNNEIFTSREKEKMKELSLSSINNIDNNSINIKKYNEQKQPHNLKKNKSFVKPPLNLSFLKNDKDDEINSVKGGKNKINLEINNINIYTNSNSDLSKNNPKRKNHSINNYRHYSTNENHIYNIKKFDIKPKKSKKNNLLNIIANIDFNLKKIIKRGFKAKRLVKNDSKFKYNKK